MEEKDRDHHHRHHRRRDSPTPMKKAQVFYYISRNGRLEQPHFLEIPLFPNHPLRLKDVLDRLAVLRGNAMPFLYSWSCKRNYKSGYVWNDLSENDVVYPAEGYEYVLKASQLVDLHASCEKLQQVHIPNNNPRQPVQEPNLPTKTRKQQLAPTPLPHHPHSDLEYDEDEDYEYDDGDKNAGEPPGQLRLRPSRLDVPLRNGLP
ncbi:protein UPSTREAM OF FLC-like isoform X2 [Cucumis sativus]|uniref:protein UPSTREAM OF FLC-like isoform X2 n=1 Tax=Cucumis sativus TaxID=3659 RepID=UPI0012F48C53|nr:protein UPSTREAM OF FLC-like isoform X2 [Cucumis sativus]XP_031745655.1 protein UPSTREAM OF FLC-like isoform X2 [Cucumis sativus]XP_031745703.1 protein UPSTREAM OF FLC-like isoform X2 [Cucumis sativus]